MTGALGAQPGAGESRTDAELLAAHVAGDPEAFGELFRRHRDRLWAVAIRTIGDQEEAADALQEAMVSAFRRAGGFRGEAAVTTWLHRIVVNACLDRVRRHRPRPVDPLPEDGSDPLGASMPIVADDSDPSATRMDVAAALAALAPDQRAAIVLVDLEGYPVAEAALMLGIPVGTVKSRCARGRTRLVPLLAHLVGDRSARTARPPGPPAGGPAPEAPPEALPEGTGPGGRLVGESRTGDDAGTGGR